MVSYRPGWGGQHSGRRLRQYDVDRTKWMTFEVLLYLRNEHRHDRIGKTARQINESTGVSVTSVANLVNRGYLVRLNPKRHPNEQFLYGLTYKYTPKRWQ